MKKTVPKLGKNHNFEAGLSDNYDGMRTKQQHGHSQHGKRGVHDITSGGFVG